jgi:hypothetical protein
MTSTSQESKRPELVALAILLAVSLAASAVWLHRWSAQSARRDQLNALYATASHGDRDSIRRLAEYPSPEATRFIERLAQDRSAFSDARLEAINVLGTRHSLDSRTLAPLLWIDQPFDVRRSVTGVFKQHGCDEDCISVTLTSLHAIWEGQPTLEAHLYAQIPPSTPHAQENLANFRKQTEEDYFVLLNSNVCLTQKILHTAHGSDSEFVDRIRKKLGPC